MLKILPEQNLKSSPQSTDGILYHKAARTLLVSLPSALAHSEHLDGFGVVGSAASAIATNPTEPGLVGVQACAVLKLQVDGFD